MKNLCVTLMAMLVGGMAMADGKNEVTEELRPAEGATVVDGLAAKVDGEVITIGEVMAEIRRDPMMRLPGARNTNVKELYRTTVDNLVNRKLILRDAEVQKLQMQDWVVDNRVREIVKDGFGGDVNKLRTALSNAHILFDDWKRGLREDLIIQAMQYQMITRNVNASPGAMRAEYAAHQEDYTSGGTMDISMILLGPADGRSAADRAKDVVARLEAGDDFAKVAAEVSADSHAKDGGAWKGVKPEGTFRPQVVEALRKIKVGERTEPVEIDGWVSIVRKDAEAGSTQLSFAEAYEQVLAAVRTNEAKRLHDEWIKRLRERSFIVVYELPGLQAPGME